MRISDWSSDVCSSDLPVHRGGIYAALRVGVFQRIAEAAAGGDDVGAELLADAGDEHLDRVGIPVEILVVDVLDQLGSADHLALVVNEVGEQLVLRSEERRVGKECVSTCRSRL